MDIYEQHELRDLASDLDDLIDAGLVAVTGRYPCFRYIVTPLGQAELKKHRDVPSRRAAWVLTPKGDEALAEPRPGFPAGPAIQAVNDRVQVITSEGMPALPGAVRAEARELAKRRHAASQASTADVVSIFGGHGA